MIVIGRRSASQTGLTIAYRILCSWCENGWCIWFGLVVAYHCLPILRSEFEPRVWNLYQSLPPLDDITHSDDAMCYVGLLRLYRRGDDRYLYDVGVLFVWLDTGVYECLGVSDGVEMARVLC